MADAPTPVDQARSATPAVVVGLVVFLGHANRLLAWALSLPIRFYRRFVSGALPPACRYEPSCSRYALEALSVHGGLYGAWLAARRLSRCHPLGGSGFDPVPRRSPPSPTAGRSSGPDLQTR